jgi:hypothetical protein
MEFTLTYNKKVKTSDDARRFWFKHNRMQIKIEKHYAPKISQALINQYKSFIKAIDEKGFKYAKNNLFIIINGQEIATIIKDLYHKSAFIESNYVLNYLRRKKKNNSGIIESKAFNFEIKRQNLGLGFEDLAPVIDQYFQIYLLKNSALPITETTRKIIINHLISEVDRGVPLEEAINNFTDLAITGGSVKSLPRAIKIAKTESTKSLSFGGLIGAYMSGVDVDKVWVTSDDERVRGLPNYPAKFSHVNLDLNEADMNGAFYNGEGIRFPGDPEASIENIANCRCAMFFKEKSNPIADIPVRQLSNFLIDLFSGLFIGLGAELLRRLQGDKETDKN